MSCLYLLVHWLKCVPVLSTDVFYCVWMTLQMKITWVVHSQLRLALWRALLQLLFSVSFVLFGLIGIWIEMCELSVHWPTSILHFDVIAVGNNLSGSIPTEIGSLTSLTFLLLDKFCLVWTYWYIDWNVCLFNPLTFLIVFEWHCRG